MQQYITPDLKQMMLNNKIITDDMLYNISTVFKPENLNKSRYITTNIIYQYLTNMTTDEIDKIYEILGNKILRYDDDDYCDKTIYKIDKYIPVNDSTHSQRECDDDTIYPLILIVNALIGKELL